MLKVFATYVPGMSIEDLRALFEAGLAGARFIYKDIEAHNFVDKLAAYEGSLSSADPRGFVVIVDLPGTKPRIGVLNPPMTLKRGMHLDLSTAVSGSTIQINNVTAAQFNRIRVGHRLLIADDSIELVVTRKDDDEIQCECVSATATLRAGRSIVFPDSDIANLPLGSTDRRLLKSGELQRRGFKVAVSFCDSPTVVRQLTDRYHVELRNIIPKIEAVLPKQVLSETIAGCEYAMLGRGDLSAINEARDWFSFQLTFIETCFELKVEPIIGTGLFPSLSESGRPTISEVSDVGYLLRAGVRSFLIAGDVSFTNPGQVLSHIKEMSDSLG